MCLRQLPDTIKFASLLSYVPEKYWNDNRNPDISDEQLGMNKQYMVALKQWENQPDGLISICESVAM